MLSKPVQDVLNRQINNEFHSAYIYLSMAAHFEATNYPGFAHWMKKQYEEEIEHGMKIFNFINERGGKVTLEAIEKPAAEFKSPLEIFTAAYKHEQKITGTINECYEVAAKEKDYPTQVMLHWFIEEQVEEEKSASEIIEQLKMVGDAPAGLLMLDRQLATRS
ncbi:MAG: ferritin [Ignavibacteria bacterium]|nr:ferritin [Ignavibacteria bacterium]